MIVRKHDVNLAMVYIFLLYEVQRHKKLNFKCMILIDIVLAIQNEKCITWNDIVMPGIYNYFICSS